MTNQPVAVTGGAAGTGAARPGGVSWKQGGAEVRGRWRPLRARDLASNRLRFPLRMSLTIWSNAKFSESDTQLLVEGVRPHRR